MIEDIIHLGLLEDGDIELDVAALEIAALDHPEADLESYVDTLGDLAERLLMSDDGSESARDQAQALARVLAREHGLRGDRDTYDDPANADLMQVLDRRKGMPVALSILYVALARRVGWDAYPLNTPGHVLVSIVADKTVLIDPFNDGEQINEAQLTSLLRGVLGDEVVPNEEHLEPMSNRDVLVRLLLNQATRAERGGDPGRALTIFSRITTIAPTYTHGWWERARLELIARQVGEARSSLSALLETTRDASLRTHVNAALDALAGS